jgi:hypothetical protein
MKELYAEGVATHGGPESCVDDPVRAWRSVDRGTCRPGYRAAKSLFRGADAVHEVEGNIAGGAIASRRWAPRGLRTRACTEPSCARTGRAHCPPVGLIYRRAAQGTLR